MAEKAYYIPEKKITIFAKDDEEFERKKAKILNPPAKYVTGGLGKKAPKIRMFN